jgi:organic radical activating enzyme
MTRETAEAVIAAVRRFRIQTLDITGGAPELNTSFRYLVTEARALGARVMVRHNLTVGFETRKLVETFNPATADGLMCRNLVNVDWTGRLYDCDFNQMLEQASPLNYLRQLRISIRTGLLGVAS